MLDKIQESFNRINAACVRARAKGGDEVLDSIATDLEALADDAEQLDVNTQPAAAEGSAPAGTLAALLEKKTDATI